MITIRVILLYAYLSELHDQFNHEYSQVTQLLHLPIHI